VVIIYVEGVLVNRENKDWRLFWPPRPFQTEGKLFVPPSPSPHKSRNFSDPLPPPLWIEKLTAMKQVCIAGKVRY
jgi:hypothetical protein